MQSCQLYPISTPRDLSRTCNTVFSAPRRRMDGDVLGDSWDEVDEIGAPAAEEPLASLSLPTAFLSEGTLHHRASRSNGRHGRRTPPGRRRFSTVDRSADVV